MSHQFHPSVVVDVVGEAQDRYPGGRAPPIGARGHSKFPKGRGNCAGSKRDK